MQRCPWCLKDPLYIHYHDTEWGCPIHDPKKLFEFLILEGMQAGLSWLTILKRRDNYREALANFEAEKLIAFTPKERGALLLNTGIIRNRAKIDSIFNNAERLLEMDDFSHYIWQFTDGRVIQNAWKSMAELPCRTEISDKMAKDLKHKGFQFVGTKICYAFMQAVGMVNDHLIDCFRYTSKK
jgi:DNA-3-methyladenine glycosylase I